MSEVRQEPDTQEARLRAVFMPQVEREIRDRFGKSNEPVDCITWTGYAEDAVEDHSELLPEGIKVYHCRVISPHDPHHWLEITFSDGAQNVFVWDGSGQKLKGTTFVPVSEATAWYGYTDPNISRVQVYPEIEDVSV